MNPEQYFEIISKLFDSGVRTELYYTNEYTLAVAVVLSAQTTDKHVNTVTPGLFKIANTPEQMLKLGEDGLKQQIKSISFFNNKAKNIIKMAEILAMGENASDWKFPEFYHDRNELMKLPGIGQKTANVVSNILWDAPHVGVDTHVFRLAHRFEWAADTDNTPEKVEIKLMRRIPKKYHHVANHLMVMHGRYVCKALRPDCLHCPALAICNYAKKLGIKS